MSSDSQREASNKNRFADFGSPIAHENEEISKINENPNKTSPPNFNLKEIPKNINSQNSLGANLSNNHDSDWEEAKDRKKKNRDEYRARGKYFKNNWRGRGKPYYKNYIDKSDSDLANALDSISKSSKNNKIPDPPQKISYDFKNSSEILENTLPKIQAQIQENPSEILNPKITNDDLANTTKEIIYFSKTYINVSREDIEQIFQECKHISDPYIHEILIHNKCILKTALNLKKISKPYLTKIQMANGWDQETDRAIQFIGGFKTKPCPISGAEHEKLDCEFYHSPSDIRRTIKYTPDNGWNYYPVLCKNKDCTLKDCLYSSNLCELQYHSLFYKTSLCKYPAIDTNFSQCSNYGERCPFAHSAEDLRNLAQLYCGTKMRNKKAKMIEKPKPQPVMEPIFDNEPQPVLSPMDSIINQEKPKSSNKFDIKTYKTIECENDDCDCKNCIFYHNILERRRQIIKYKPEMCPKVFIEGRFESPLKCPKGDNCEYCHTKNELYYHPTNYKTKICERKPCKYGPEFCPDNHIEDEKFKKKYENQEPELIISPNINEAYEKMLATKDEYRKTAEKMRNWKCERCSEFFADRCYLGTKCFHMICLACKNEEKCPVCDKEQLMMKIHLFGHAENSNISSLSENSNSVKENSN